jgi:hypothetical protein
MPNRMTVVVTGHGRSGTHWLAKTLGHFVDARHEPDEIGGAVTVSAQLTQQMPRILKKHTVVHLVRDGRDVVRSAYEFYGGNQSFEELCHGWADTIETMKDVRAVRLEDLLKPQAQTAKYRLTHWSEWPEDLHATFWTICGEAMKRHGYG